jgi:hypothetical protein
MWVSRLIQMLNDMTKTKFVLIFLLFNIIGITFSQEIRVQFFKPIGEKNEGELSILKKKFPRTQIKINSIYNSGVSYDFFTKNPNDYNVNKNLHFSTYEKTLEFFKSLKNKKTNLFIWPLEFKSTNLSLIAQKYLNGDLTLSKKGAILPKNSLIKEIKKSLKNGYNVELLYLNDTLDYEYSCNKLVSLNGKEEVNWVKRLGLVGPETVYLKIVNGENYYTLYFKAPTLPLDGILNFETKIDGVPIKLQFNLASVNETNIPNQKNVFVKRNLIDGRIEIFLPYLLFSNNLKEKVDRLKLAYPAEDILYGFKWKIGLELFKRDCAAFYPISSENNVIIFSCSHSKY